MCTCMCVCVCACVCVCSCMRMFVRASMCDQGLRTPCSLGGETSLLPHLCSLMQIVASRTLLTLPASPHTGAPPPFFPEA